MPVSGILTGVGVGPGDPELVTLKAARLIGSAERLAYPALPGVPSLARRIVADLIRPGTPEIVIEVPMTAAREPAQSAYDAGAARIAAELSAGRSVVCLCEGDPLFYGSFLYLASRLRDRFRVVTVPGVTSMTACAAVAGRALAARDEVLAVIPATLPDPAIRRAFAAADRAVVMKVGRHLPRLRALFAGAGLRASYVARAGFSEEAAMPLAEAPEAAPYFSTLLIDRGGDPWT